MIIRKSIYRGSEISLFTFLLCFRRGKNKEAQENDGRSRRMLQGHQGVGNEGIKAFKEVERSFEIRF